MHRPAIIFVALGLLLVFGSILSGSIGFGSDECELPRGEVDSNDPSAYRIELTGKWNHTYDTRKESGGNGIDFGVYALRTSPPDLPYRTPEGEVYDENHVDWDRIRGWSKPEIVHDLLCMSEWRRENNPRMTHYGTFTVVGEPIFEDAMEKLRKEYERQNGEDAKDWCCYILYNGEFYATNTREVRTY